MIKRCLMEIQRKGMILDCSLFTSTTVLHSMMNSRFTYRISENLTGWSASQYWAFERTARLIDWFRHVASKRQTPQYTTPIRDNKISLVELNNVLSNETCVRVIKPNGIPSTPLCSQNFVKSPSMHLFAVFLWSSKLYF